eukprot:SAG11_NODE_461_length_9234_cov_10.929611_8_plen_83_part_00
MACLHTRIKDKSARKPGVKEISSPTFCFSRCILVFIINPLLYSIYFYRRKKKKTLVLVKIYKIVVLFNTVVQVLKTISIAFQ